MRLTGMAPVYSDGNGQNFVDGDNVQGLDEAGAFLGIGPQARYDRIQRRIGRLTDRQQMLGQRLGINPGSDAEVATPMWNADARAIASQKGLVEENQYNGLGAGSAAMGTVSAPTTTTLTDAANRDFWIKAFVLDADTPSSAGVSAISIAGLPVNIGSKSMPLSAFISTSTRFGISFGRRLVRTGQTVSVSISNFAAAQTVQAGLIVDEMAPYLVQGIAENGLLNAVASFGQCGY